LALEIKTALRPAEDPAGDPSSRSRDAPGAEAVAPIGGAAFHDNKVWVKKAIA
jgi:hypothetical protein